MHLNDLTEELEKALDVKFFKTDSKYRQNGEKWTIVNVVVHDSVQIGTITFRNDMYYHHKLGKSEDRRDVCIIDQKFYRLERYMFDGFIIPLAMYSALLGYAEQIAAWDLSKKKRWRLAHPKESRKPLTGKNVRFILRALILNISDNKDKFRESIINIIETYYCMPELAQII